MKNSRSLFTRRKIQFCSLSAETPVSASSFSFLLCHPIKVSKHGDHIGPTTPSASHQICDRAQSPNPKINNFDLMSKNISHLTFETIYDDDRMVLNIMEAMIYIRKHMKIQNSQKSEIQPSKNHILSGQNMLCCSKFVDFLSKSYHNYDE